MTEDQSTRFGLLVVIYYLITILDAWHKITQVASLKSPPVILVKLKFLESSLRVCLVQTKLSSLVLNYLLKRAT